MCEHSSLEESNASPGQDTQMRSTSLDSVCLLYSSYLDEEDHSGLVCTKFSKRLLACYWFLEERTPISDLKILGGASQVGQRSLFPLAPELRDTR